VGDAIMSYSRVRCPYFSYNLSFCTWRGQHILLITETVFLATVVLAFHIPTHILTLAIPSFNYINPLERSSFPVLNLIMFSAYAQSSG